MSEEARIFAMVTALAIVVALLVYFRDVFRPLEPLFWFCLSICVCISAYKKFYPK